MRRTLISVWLLALACQASAASWQFGGKISISPHSGKGIFHQLDGTGRKHIAASGDHLAVVWADNHEGSSQVYAAFKKLDAKKFSAPVRLSTASGYSPVVTSLGEKGFLFGWERDGSIVLRAVRDGSPGVALHLDRQGGSSQVALASDGKVTYAAWVKTTQKNAYIVVSQLSVTADKQILIAKSTIVEPAPPVSERFYPTLAPTSDGGVAVLWEDRRRKHTTIMASHGNAELVFSQPRVINEVVKKSSSYGRGSGVTRAALASVDGKMLAATWMDKRGFKTGYDIYAGISNNQGRDFGKNQMVQDLFGENRTQWNPAIAADSAGDIAVSWDDDRDETSDIWYSLYSPQGWSEDFVVEPASGKGLQTAPAITFDRNRNLHVIWIERDSDFGPTRLFYTAGKVSTDNP